MENIVRYNETEYTREQINLIKSICCKNGSDADLELLLYASRKRGLDPLLKQIHSVARWDSDAGAYVRTLQTGIDGFRVIARRSGRYAGQKPVEWCGNDGVWRDVWLSEKMPYAAKASVYVNGFVEPVTAVALFDAYVQTKKDKTPNLQWSKNGIHMIGKCAEALALRKAFPEDLSGLYVEEEMLSLQDEKKQGSKYDYTDVNNHATQAQLYELKGLVENEHIDSDRAYYIRWSISMVERGITAIEGNDIVGEVHALTKAEAQREISYLRSEVQAAQQLACNISSSESDDETDYFEVLRVLMNDSKFDKQTNAVVTRVMHIVGQRKDIRAAKEAVHFLQEKYKELQGVKHD